MKRFNFLIILLVTVVMMLGCETKDPLIDQASTMIVIGNYDQAIQITTQALEEDSSKGYMYYYRGLAQASKAQDLADPSERTPLYADSRMDFDMGVEWMSQAEKTPQELEDTDPTLLSFWAYEFNEGVGNLNNDSLRALVPDPDAYAIANFSNAIVIIPDSTVSYEALSYAHQAVGDLASAIEAYEQVLERKSAPTLDDYTFATNLYLRNDQYDMAEKRALEALDLFPENTIQVIPLLADVYINIGETEKAIELIRDLIADDPTNDQYYRVLGIQIYQNAEEVDQELSGMYEQLFELDREIVRANKNPNPDTVAKRDALKAEIAELEEQTNKLTQMSVDEILKSVDLNPEYAESYRILGVIHQNKAANLDNKRNYTLDNDEALEYDNQAKEVLTTALGYYEKASELDPENADLWQSLFQVYSRLGMTEKAMEAMDKAGL
ncbi:MAG: hypothetical protein DA446_02020 [Bacteroidetes bacterium]|jgi:tetratricopeptide (TPR) repeat protein|nr:MAG: hypothetical protein DA446_02020 [Bacteroidota bacterium]